MVGISVESGNRRWDKQRSGKRRSAIFAAYPLLVLFLSDPTLRHSRPALSQVRSEDGDQGRRVGTVVFTNGCLLREHRGGNNSKGNRLNRLASVKG